MQFARLPLGSDWHCCKRSLPLWEDLADQEMASNRVKQRDQLQAEAMGLLHCPLCMGLAVLSALRFSAHAVMAFQLERHRWERSCEADRSMGMAIICDQGDVPSLL